MEKSFYGQARAHLKHRCKSKIENRGGRVRRLGRCRMGFQRIRSSSPSPAVSTASVLLVREDKEGPER